MLGRWEVYLYTTILSLPYMNRVSCTNSISKRNDLFLGWLNSHLHNLIRYHAIWGSKEQVHRQSHVAHSNYHSWFIYCMCNSWRMQLLAAFLDWIGLILTLLQPVCERQGHVDPWSHHTVHILLIEVGVCYCWIGIVFLATIHVHVILKKIKNNASGVWVFDGVCVFDIIYPKHWYLCGIIAVVSICARMVLIQIILVYTNGSLILTNPSHLNIWLVLQCWQSRVGSLIPLLMLIVDCWHPCNSPIHHINTSKYYTKFCI